MCKILYHHHMVHDVRLPILLDISARETQQQQQDHQQQRPPPVFVNPSRTPYHRCEVDLRPVHDFCRTEQQCPWHSCCYLSTHRFVCPAKPAGVGPHRCFALDPEHVHVRHDALVRTHAGRDGKRKGRRRSGGGGGGGNVVAAAWQQGWREIPGFDGTRFDNEFQIARRVHLFSELEMVYRIVRGDPGRGSPAVGAISEKAIIAGMITRGMIKDVDRDAGKLRDLAEEVEQAIGEGMFCSYVAEKLGMGK